MNEESGKPENENMTPSSENENESSAEDQLREKADELNEKYLRLYSEFDNYRKRTLRERIELSKTATADIISKLLPVLDDFERAIKAFESSGEACKPMQEGIVLIFNKLLNILGQQGLESMNSIGKEFDTDFHEAITNVQAPSEDLKGKVVDEIEKGYLLNGKVIRFAKVVVGN